MRAALAIAGYCGTVFWIRFPCMTPEEIVSFFGGATLTFGACSDASENAAHHASAGRPVHTKGI